MSLRSIVHLARRWKKVLTGQDCVFPIQVRSDKRYLGSEYGGWSILSGSLDANSIVYSFGVGTDITFDLALIETFGVTVHAFDPTPGSIEWVKSQSLPEQFVLHEYGVASYDGVATFFPPVDVTHISHTLLDRPDTADRKIEVPVYRLVTIMKMLGHTKIDLLKMDIEGAEYDVIKDMLAGEIRPKQLAVEFHHRWENVGTAKTKEAMAGLQKIGYQIFDRSKTWEEYSLVMPPEKP